MNTPAVEIRTGPYVKRERTVEQIMLNVVYAIVPIALFSVYQYGLSAAALIITVTATCLLTERWLNKLANKPGTLSDFSGTITGLLLALSLPPSFPLWMGAVSGFVAIALGKMLFGGIGYNVFNPALVGRAFAQAAWPSTIASYVPAFAKQRFADFIPSTWTAPLMLPPDNAGWIKASTIDAFSGATPLARWKFENFVYAPPDFLTGAVTASAGETTTILILLCGAYLAWKRYLDWRIPVAVLGSAALVALGFHLADPGHYPNVPFVMLSGGLMFGAVFMATDMVTSPVTPKAVWIYGAVIGVLTVVIRYFGGLNEGVMYAILVGNALTPLIEQYTQPRLFGSGRKKVKK
jgi:Na+-translocating ferredoxin:NAD+ oxidoreductase subunit D